MANIDLDKTIQEVVIEIEHHKRQIKNLHKICEGHIESIQGLKRYLAGLQGLDTLKMMCMREDKNQQ